MERSQTEWSLPADGSREPRRAVSAPQSHVILTIDDDRDARCIWAECLSHLGYRVLSEANGEDGLRAARREKPLAILMDVTMPGMGGVEATRRLKADAQTKDCLVIIVTGQGPSIFAEVRAAGCDAYFCKPFDAFALNSILRVLTAETRKARRTTAVKRCLCGRSYTREQWLRLRLWGAMHIPHSDESIEVRDCPCGSPVLMPLQDAWADAPVGAIDREWP